MSDAAPTYPDPQAEQGVRERIRDKVKAPRLTRELASAAELSTEIERVPLPIRLPKMYYEALKEYSTWSTRSMNAIVVEAIGEYLKNV